MAERGALARTGDGTPEVVMFNGTRQESSRGTDRLSLLHFDNYAMEFSEGRERRKPAEATTPASNDVGPAGRRPGKTVPLALYRQYRVELHQRLASPLYDLPSRCSPPHVCWPDISTGAASSTGSPSAWP